MPRDRFLLIYRNLSFQDQAAVNVDINEIEEELEESQIEEDEKLTKGERYVNIMKKKFLEGAKKCDAYLKDKPHPYGLKVYAVVMGESRLILNTETYFGCIKDDDNSLAELVKRMIQPINELNPIEGKTLVCDNYYTTFDVVTEVNKGEWDYIGTINENRFIPDKKRIALKLNEDRDEIYKQGSNIRVYEKQVKRNRTLRIMHTVGSIDEVTRERVGKNPTKRAEIHQMYQDYYPAVDKVDQWSSYIAWPHKCCSWTTAFFMHALQVAIINAFIFFKKQVDLPKYHIRNFVKNLAYVFAKEGTEINQQEVQPEYDSNKLEDHELKRITNHDGEKINHSRKCPYCDDKTYWRCSCCEVMCQKCYIKHVYNLGMERGKAGGK